MRVLISVSRRKGLHTKNTLCYTLFDLHGFVCSYCCCCEENVSFLKLQKFYGFSSSSGIHGHFTGKNVYYNHKPQHIVRIQSCPQSSLSDPVVQYENTSLLISKIGVVRCLAGLYVLHTQYLAHVFNIAELLHSLCIRCQADTWQHNQRILLKVITCYSHIHILYVYASPARGRVQPVIGRETGVGGFCNA